MQQCVLIHSILPHHFICMPGENGMNKDRELLWRLYSRVYDAVMVRFLPYQLLTERVAAALNPSLGSRMLDAGCGTGQLVQFLLRSRSDVEVVGIDFSEAMLRRARAKSTNLRKTTWLRVDLNYPLPFSEEEFDAITCVNVLYAVSEPLSMLRELRRVLRQGGRLVLVTPIFKPGMSNIFAEHVRLLSKNKPKTWVIILIGQIIRLAPALVVFVAVNRSIQESPLFHFLNEHQLRRVLVETGFRVSSLERVYGGQAWLVVGYKDDTDANLSIPAGGDAI